MKKFILCITLLLISIASYANNPLTITQQTSNSNKDGTNITLQYPQYTGTDLSPEAKQFNQLVDQVITDETSQFKSLVTDAHTTSESTLEIKSEVYQLPTPYVSVRFIITSFVGGGAYPNVHHRTLNFNLNTGQIITLEELFKPSANYTEIFDTYFIKTLSKKTNLPATEIKDSSALNYKHWNMTRDGILISFDDFPHALGEPEVMIPYTILKHILAFEPLDLQ